MGVGKGSSWAGSGQMGGQLGRVEVGQVEGGELAKHTPPPSTDQKGSYDVMPARRGETRPKFLKKSTMIIIISSPAFPPQKQTAPSLEPPKPHFGLSEKAKEKGYD